MKVIFKVQKFNDALKHTKKLAYLGTMSVGATTVLSLRKSVLKEFETFVFFFIH